jgi:hypothetical protein
MFKLAESRGSSRGLYCGSDGLFIGPSPLIECRDGIYRVRRRDQRLRAECPNVDVQR